MEFDWTLNMGDLLTAASLLAAAISVWVAMHAVKRDHVRRRKQATVEYMRELRAQYRSSWHEITNDIGAIDEHVAKEIFEDPDKKFAIEQLLSMFEHVATAANEDVFDIELLSRLSGTFLVEVFKKTRAYMVKARQDQLNWLESLAPGVKSDKYTEYEALVKELCGRRGLPFDGFDRARSTTA